MSTSSAPFLVRTNMSRSDSCYRPYPPHNPQNASPASSKASLPIAIPRRKNVHPPPRSPIRNQPSPEFVFNLDFSPCSFQGAGILARMDIHARKDVGHDWTQPFLQQRGRTNVLLAHQCQQPQRLMFARKTRSPSVRHYRPYMREPAARVQSSCAISEDHAITEQENIDCDGYLDPDTTLSVCSPPSKSSVCSSPVFAASLADFPEADSVQCAHGHLADDIDTPYLTNAFQQSISSASPSNQSQGTTLASEPVSPSSPIRFYMPSPVSPPPMRPYPYQAPRALPLAGARDRAHLLRSGAAPVVSFKVAQAERASIAPRTPVRGRSPYPGLGLRPRQRRGSSAGARAPTVVGTGRAIGMRGVRGSSIVLSNEDIERSLEKEDRARERTREREKREGDTEDWDCERGRTRGRPRGRGVGIGIGITGLRPALGHL